MNWPAGCRFATRCDHAYELCYREEPALFQAGVQQAACWLCQGGRRAEAETSV